MDIIYSRGSILSELLGQEPSPEQTDIVSRVFIRANLACTDAVETAYYSSGVLDDVCVHCGVPKDIVIGEYEADILPTCKGCFNDQTKLSLQTEAIKCNQPQRRGTNDSNVL